VFDDFLAAKAGGTLGSGTGGSISGDRLSLSISNAGIDTVIYSISGGALRLTQTSATWPISNYGAAVYAPFSGLTPSTAYTLYVTFTCGNTAHSVWATTSDGQLGNLACSGSRQVLAIAGAVDAGGGVRVTLGFGKASDTIAIDAIAIGSR